MAPLRRLCLCLPALLLLLLLLPAPPVAAAPAPVPVPVPGTDWAACKNLSRELSRLLGTLKEPHSELNRVQIAVEDPEGDCATRIRCSDACDPSALDTNNTRCLRRILQGLQHYRDLLGSEIFSAHRLPQLEATLDRLLGVVQAPGRPCQAPLGPTTPTWAESLLPQLRHQALEQLQSFTAVMRRVFTYSARPH
ncbi:interleukin-23 subunit alpha isoform X2 [Anser cygnoides]|uniref:interleukin-23 subunit alpha isoform X2 n=1 Tax=Anser cygnoides TaxID=8845 RepID=UPI0034D2B2D4